MPNLIIVADIVKMCYYYKITNHNKTKSLCLHFTLASNVSVCGFMSLHRMITECVYYKTQYNNTNCLSIMLVCAFIRLCLLNCNNTIIKWTMINNQCLCLLRHYFCTHVYSVISAYINIGGIDVVSLTVRALTEWS